MGIADFIYNTEYLRIMKNKNVFSKIIRRPFHSFFLSEEQCSYMLGPHIL